MKRHVLSQEDVAGVFARPFVVPLASCTRENDKQKVLEHHLDLKEPFYSRYIVRWRPNAGAAFQIMYTGNNQAIAIAKYNELDT